jgi:hypothetical protein
MAAHPVAIRALQLLSSLFVGLALLVAPWTSLWDQHPALAISDEFRRLALSPWTRGSISGVGLLNLVAAAFDAFQIFRPRADTAARG